MRAYSKIVVFLFLAFLTSHGAFAQKDKIEELRASFISKRLQLSSEESVKFWPVYNEMNDKLKEIKMKLRKAYRQLPENYSDKDAETIIDLENNCKQAEAEITKKYNDKLKLIIGSKKLVQLQICENEFKKEVINLIKEK